MSPLLLGSAATKKDRIIELALLQWPRWQIAQRVNVPLTSVYTVIALARREGHDIPPPRRNHAGEVPQQG